MLQDIIDAGGVLELTTKGDDTNYGNLVAIINRRQMAPDGQQVILMDGASYYQKVFRLSSVAEWKTQPPAEVVAADRIGRWHPAVAALRSENRLSSIESPQRQRALRLLHALAREAEARGYTVNAAPKREQRGYGHHDRDHLPGMCDRRRDTGQVRDRDHTAAGQGAARGDGEGTGTGQAVRGTGFPLTTTYRRSGCRSR